MCILCRKVPLGLKLLYFTHLISLFLYVAVTELNMCKPLHESVMEFWKSCTHNIRQISIGMFSSFFLSSFCLAVYLLRLQEELLLFVLRAAGEPARLRHVSPVKGDRLPAAEAHAFAGQGPATILAAPQRPH